MTLSDLKKRVISGINEEWTTLEVIRYVYLEVGKALSKDTDFFFSVNNKLQEKNLSFDEIKEIYNSDEGRDLKVICRSASTILKSIYDELGIRSQLVETTTSFTTDEDIGEFDVFHFLLAAYDDDGKAIFMTLTPDLPYIQSGMETMHFGSNIPYTRTINDVERYIYKGDKIDHKALSRQEIRSIDEKIGYLQFYYPYNDKNQETDQWYLNYDNASMLMIKDAFRDNKLFYEEEMFDSYFYNSMYNFVGSDGKRIDISDGGLKELSYDDLTAWIKNICNQVEDKISELIGFDLFVIPRTTNMGWTYERWLFNLVTKVEDEIYNYLDPDKEVPRKDLRVNVFDFKFNKWAKNVKKKCNYSYDISDYNNIFLILEKLNTIVNCVRNDFKGANLRTMMHSLAFHFIPGDSIYENSLNSKGILSNYYIAKKFMISFTKIFGCNSYNDCFNKMDYSEQIVIIKETLPLIFPELNKDNSFSSNYDENYSAVLNRIQIYPIKSKSDGHYSIVFDIPGISDDETDYFFYFNPKTNVFRPSDILDIYNDYIIISDRMKKKYAVEDMEDLSFGK